MSRMLKTFAASISRYADVLVFFALLVAIGWMLLTGNDKAFLHPRFRLFLVGGAMLLVAFIMVIVFGGKRLESGRPWAMRTAQALVVTVPLLFLYTIVGHGLGAHALTKKYTGNEQQTLARLLEGGPGKTAAVPPSPDLSLLDIARRMKQIDGRRVVTEGLVYRPDIMPPNTLTLFRFAIFCCAADALPVWVFVEYAGVAAFDDENWIRVDGTVQIVNFNGTDVPVIKADNIVKTAAPAPAEQYLFF